MSPGKVNLARTRPIFRDVISYAQNNLRQWGSPDVKIFFIGFNKCGTSAIHHLLSQNGIISAHCKVENENVARGIDERLPDTTALKAYLNRWTAYSDLNYWAEKKLIEGNRHFRLFHQLFPDSYFVLNDRDIEAWILSRKNHRRGMFLFRCSSAMNIDSDSVIRMWRENYADHASQVTRYFQGSPRFLHFRIDRDPIANLVRLLSPDFSISERHWQVLNITERLQEGAVRRVPAMEDRTK